MDIEYYKYKKYMAKNSALGGSFSTALSILSTGINAIDKGVTVAKKTTNAARLTALKNAKIFKTIIQEPEMKKILGENEQKELISILDDLIVILNITSLEEIYDKKDEITNLVNKLNELVQKSPLDDNKKKNINDIVEFLNMVSQNSD